MKTVTQLNYRKRLAITISSLFLAILLLSLYLLFATSAHIALANKTNEYNYCQSGTCHISLNSTGVQYVGRYDPVNELVTGGGTKTILVNGTSNPTVDMWIGQDRTVEFDWFYNAWGSPNDVVSKQIVVSDGWTVTKGESNTAPTFSTPWNTVWDNTDNVQATNPTYSYWGPSYTTNVPYGWKAHSLRFYNKAGSDWSGVTNKLGAKDDAGTYDLDGVADRMGTDARITTTGFSEGTFPTYLDSVGHDSGGTKGYKRVTLQMSIANITTSWAEGVPYSTPGQTLDIRTTLFNTSWTTNLSGSRLRYWVFRDTVTADAKPSASEPYLRSDNTWNASGYTAANWRNESAGEKTGINLSTRETRTEAWTDRTNTNFPDLNATYTCYVEWYQDGTNLAIIDDTNCTFVSVPTLGWWLTTVVILFVAAIGVSSGALYLRRNHH